VQTRLPAPLGCHFAPSQYWTQDCRCAPRARALKAKRALQQRTFWDDRGNQSYIPRARNPLDHLVLRRPRPCAWQELELPSPPPPLRDGVTEVHYSRWVVEENNKEVGEELRQFHQSQKGFRKTQVEKFLVDQHRKVEDSHHQMASASAAVETVRLKNLETGQEMRLNLLELKQSMHLEKQVWSAKGRELVEHAKNVQSAKVLERQLSHRGKRQAMGAKTKSEREQLTQRRESLKQTAEEKKREIVERIKAEMDPQVASHSKSLLQAEKAHIGNYVRELEAQAVEKRSRARAAFLAQMADQRRDVDAAKSGAKSARAGLASYRRQQADEVRQARQAEKERKKALQEDVKRRNKEVHDILYSQKFAPRERATKVNLPGRIVSGKAFNAYDAEAAAAESAAQAAAPSAADPGSPMLGAGGSPGGAGRRQRAGDDGWNDDA
jgi:hypothetical protein